MTTWFYPGQEDYITKLNELGAIAELLSGPDGWSPELAVVPDGERRVFQVADWVGGETTKPPIGDYVGSTGYVSNIADAIDIRGPQGVDGADGAAGPSNVLSIGTVTGGATASATITGTSPSQVLNLVLPKGDPGTNGTDGLAATIAVGTVTTGAPGTSATVVNSGTSSAAVFDFTIPRGDTGAGGGGSGDVVGPASATNNGVALFDGATGKIIKDGGVLGTAAFEAATSFATAAQGTKADTAVQPGSLATVATSGAYADLTGKPTLGTASTLNVPATGDAATGEVVKGTDTRLSDSRTPTGTAGGVLSGSYPNPSFAVDMATQAELDVVSGVASAKLSDAPNDGKTYGRKNAAWAEVAGGYVTGDILITARTLSTPDWLECENIYLKSSYPDLAALLGSITGVVWEPAPGSQTATPGSNGTAAVRTATGAIVCVGFSGGVWRSTDNGVNFVKISGPNTTDTLQAITLAKNTAGQPDVLVAVGNSGAVWRSTDDGLTFTKQTGPNTTDLLLGVSASGTVGGTIVAVGQSGVVWRSTNIGVSWSKITGPNTTDLLYNVLFLDGTNVIATLASNAIWRSNNSGSSWTRASISASASGQWPIRLNSNVLLSAAPASRIARSADNGNTWVDTGYTAGNTSNCRAVVRLSDTEAFVVQSNGTIRHSVDEGQTWVQVDQPYYSAGATAGIAISATEALVIGTNWSLIMDGAYYDSVTQFSTPRFRSAISGAKRYIKT